MQGRIRRPSPALLIALIAFFVAIGGGAYALSTLPKNSVGSKQLKKNAVTSVKVKNHSLVKKDFKANQLPSGPRGATGPQGAPGATGATGPGGPSGIGPAFETDWNDAAHAINVTTSSTPIVSENLPAGAYAISANIQFDNRTDTNPAVVSCTITAGSDSATAGLYITGSAAAFHATLPLQVTHTFATSGPASVACQKSFATGSAFVDYASLIATQVSSQTRTQLHG